LNLITVVTTESQLATVERVLDGLSNTNPSRSLVLLAQEERPGDKLEARVSAQTRTESGHRVTTEEVLIHAHGQVAAHLASIVTPLLIPDLPVVLWWPGRPAFDSQLFHDLCVLADRLVVDTDDGFEPQDFRRLLEVSRRDHARASIGDFNWARLIAWRHIAAQFFDMPGMLSRLGQIQGATVFHGVDRGTAQARLLGGWIQSRMAKVGIEVPVELRTDDAHDHDVTRLMIYTGGEDGPARFSVSRRAGAGLATEIRIAGQELGGHTVRLQPRPPAELLAIELTLPGHDVLYEDALAAALR
jgi:glucose-6-phosphate dehydrogenase assembly protein OpcA